MANYVQCTKNGIDKVVNSRSAFRRFVARNVSNCHSSFMMVAGAAFFVATMVFIVSPNPASAQADPVDCTFATDDDGDLKPGCTGKDVDGDDGVYVEITADAALTVTLGKSDAEGNSVIRNQGDGGLRLAKNGIEVYVNPEKSTKSTTVIIEKTGKIYSTEHGVFANIDTGNTGELIISHKGSIVSVKAGIHALRQKEGDVKITLGTGSSIFTDGPDAIASGILANITAEDLELDEKIEGKGNIQITTTDASISTIGKSASGIRALARDGSISLTVTGGEIFTAGANAYGIGATIEQFLTVGKTAAEDREKKSISISVDGRVWTGGDGSHGVQAEHFAKGDVTIDVKDGAKITANGFGSHGVYGESGHFGSVTFSTEPSSVISALLGSGIKAEITTGSEFEVDDKGQYKLDDDDFELMKFLDNLGSITINHKGSITAGTTGISALVSRSSGYSAHTYGSEANPTNVKASEPSEEITPKNAIHVTSSGKITVGLKYALAEDPTNPTAAENTLIATFRAGSDKAAFDKQLKAWLENGKDPDEISDVEKAMITAILADDTESINNEIFDVYKDAINAAIKQALILGAFVDGRESKAIQDIFDEVAKLTEEQLFPGVEAGTKSDDEIEAEQNKRIAQRVQAEQDDWNPVYHSYLQIAERLLTGSLTDNQLRELREDSAEGWEDEQLNALLDYVSEDPIADSERPALLKKLKDDPEYMASLSFKRLKKIRDEITLIQRVFAARMAFGTDMEGEAGISAIVRPDNTELEDAILKDWYLEDDTANTPAQYIAAERKVHQAVLAGDRVAFAAALKELTDLEDPDTVYDSSKIEALANKYWASYNSDNIRVDITGGEVASAMGHGIIAKYSFANDKNGMITVMVSEGATVMGGVDGIHTSNAGTITGKQTVNGIQFDLKTRIYRNQVVIVDGTVTGGTGAGVHVENGGFVFIGPKARISAGEGQPAIQANETPGELIVVFKVDSPEGFLGIGDRIGPIENGDHSMTQLLAQIGSGALRAIGKTGTESALAAGVFDVGFAIDGNDQLTLSSEMAPRAQVFEAIPSALLILNGITTLDQRKAAQESNGSQSSGTTNSGSRAWVQADFGGGSFSSETSTWGSAADDNSNTGYDFRKHGFAAGFDFPSSDEFVVGVSVHHRSLSADVANQGGTIKLTGTGFGVSGTYSNEELYVDLTATYTNFDADLTSSNRGVIASGASGSGQAIGIEAGMAFGSGSVTLTPRAGFETSSASLKNFTLNTNAGGGNFTMSKAKQTLGRVGVRLDKSSENSSFYATADIENEMSKGAGKVSVAGTQLEAKGKSSARVRVGLGGSVLWNGGRSRISSSIGYTSGYDGGYSAGVGLNIAF